MECGSVTKARMLTRGRATPRRRLGSQGGVRFRPAASASHAVCVLAVEQGAMLSGIGDVVAHAGEPLERVQGFEVPAQGGIHPRAIENRLLAVEVDQLLERERVSDEVGGGVLEALLVRSRDRLTHVGRETRMPPGEQLLDQLLGDGALVEEASEQPFAKQRHEPHAVPLRQGMPRRIGRSAGVGGDEVQVRMPLQEISRGGDRDHYPGPRVGFAARIADQLLDGLGACAGELTEQFSPAPE
jgi:hypothetical protein